jgi:hypothetical protein
MSYIASGLAVASLATSAYGVYKSSKAEDKIAGQMGQGKRDYATELMATLKAQKKAAPALYNLESKYQPMYANLYLSTMQQQAKRQGTIAQQQQGIYNTLMDRQRAQEMATLQGAAPAYVQQYLEAMPGVGQINEAIVGMAMQDLALGKSISEEEARGLDQMARQAYAARGVGTSDQAALAEVLNRYQFANQREAQRRAFAQSAMASSAALSQPALQRVLGAETAPLAYGVSQGAVQQAMQAGPRLFNPESSYAGNLYNMNSQMTMANLAAQNQAASQTAAAYGQLASSLAGAAGGVYGANKGATAGKRDSTSPSSYSGSGGDFSS